MTFFLHRVAMSYPSRSGACLLAAAATLALAACQAATPVPCPPTDPLCGPQTGPTVTAVAVTSAIDTVMAVGATAQLSAAATDGSGNPVTVTFSWTSTPASVASVSQGGVLSAVSAGTATVSATADGTTGSLRMHAVDADLTGISATFNDAYRQALTGALAAATASTLNTRLNTCATDVTAGNILAINACLTIALAINGAGGNDDALLAVLDLYIDHAQRLLALGG